MPLSAQSRPDGAFLTTRWSMVLRAAHDDHAGAAEALEGLCQAYWHPLYCFVRRQGYGPEEAGDLTQDFFATLLRHDLLMRAHPEKGRFRSYLLGVMKNVMAQSRDRAATAKRGGGTIPLSVDGMDAETRYRLEPADEESPDVLFDRQWARTVMVRATERLRADYVSAGHEERFHVLREFLLPGKQDMSYAKAAAALALSEGALKSAVFKLRQRFSEALRAEIADTVSAESEVEAELRYLARALGA